MGSTPPIRSTGASLSDLLSTATASARESVVGTSTFGAWTLRYVAAANAQGEYLLHSVELSLDGSTRARMTLVRPNLSHEQVVDVLREKAKRWIREYETREHGGNTDFGPL